MAIAIEPTDALIVVDIQNDFCAGGPLEVRDGASVIPLVNDMASRFPLVVFTQDWHGPGHVSFASTHGRQPFETIELAYGTQTLWPDHCVMGTPGAEFHEGLDQRWAQAIIRKGFHGDVDSYSAFLEADRATSTGLAGYLQARGVRRVFVCGLALDFCVGWTAIDARGAGLDVTVVENACRAIDLDGSLDRCLEKFAELGIVRSDWT